jgi:electron transport complex protein RnfG
MNTQQQPATGSDPGESAGKRGIGLAALILLAAIAGLLLYAVDRTTRQRIADNQAAYALQTLNEVLPASEYDNQPHRDVFMASNEPLLGSAAALPVYRARQGTEPVAIVLTVLAPGGYVAPIRLLVAVNTQGEIIGLRALLHKETPGLGDRIDADKSDWLQQFLGLAAEPGQAKSQTTRLKRDGGTIDHISGATITSRAVSSAVTNALIYFGEHRDKLLNGNPAMAPGITEPARQPAEPGLSGIELMGEPN